MNWLIASINLSPWAFSGGFQGSASGEVASEQVSCHKYSKPHFVSLQPQCASPVVKVYVDGLSSWQNVTIITFLASSSLHGGSMQVEMI